MASQSQTKHRATWGWIGAGAGLLAAWAGGQTNLWLAAPGLAAGVAALALARALGRGVDAQELSDTATDPTGLEDLAPFLEALPEPALLVDADNRIAGSNAAARREFAFEAKGLVLSALLRHPDLLDAVSAAVHDSAARTVEYETAAQVEQHIRCYVAPLSWGEAHAALLVFHDQTARINTERMRADFLANASHELRTPLASLSLLIETLLGPARDNAADRDRFLGMMQAQALRMRRLIEDLLSLSRIELDEHVPPSERSDLALVASEAVDSLSTVAAERGVRLVLKPCSQTMVVGERFQLAQVIQNLIDNAIKYAPKASGIEIEIGVESGREAVIERAGKRWPEAGHIALLTPAPTSDPNYAFVRVEDQGPGMARRYLPRLGERFFRVERESGSEKTGTGLGLAIVKHVVNRHRGGFVVESQPGKGSAFAVYFQLAVSAGQAGRNAGQNVTIAS